MKSIVLFLGMLSFPFLANFQSEKMVYVCQGSASTKYHLVKDCKGLEKCSTDIDSISIKDAKELGRTLCGWED